MTEVLAVWAAELQAELDAAHLQLTAARREFADASEAARNERRELNTLLLALAAHDARIPLAGALQRRVSDRQDAVRRALGAATRCEAAVTAMVAKIGDVETALRQLDQLQPRSAEDAPAAA